VAEDDGALRAFKTVGGVATGEERAAPPPGPGHRLMAALGRPRDVLLTIWRTPMGIECHELSARGLEPRFAVPLSAAPGAWVVAGGRKDRIVVASAEGGVERVDVGYDGAVLHSARQFNTDLRARDLRIDAVDDAVKAAFWDGPGGQHLQLVVAQDTGPRVFYHERVGPLRDLQELGWDSDRSGRFCVAANTPDGLYYWSRGEAPQLLLPGAEPRRPVVVAQRGAFLGLADRARGYNFYEYRDGLRRWEEPTS